MPPPSYKLGTLNRDLTMLEALRGGFNRAQAKPVWPELVGAEMHALHCEGSFLVLP